MDTQETTAVDAVYFISRDDAQALRPPLRSVIVSIHDASEPPAQLQDGWADRITLQFHDTDSDDGVLTAFSREQAQQLVEFVHLHRSRTARIYVHCSLGVSRSAGIALAVADMLQVPCLRKGKPETTKTWPRLNRRCFELLQLEAMRSRKFY